MLSILSVLLTAEKYLFFRTLTSHGPPEYFIDGTTAEPLATNGISGILLDFEWEQTLRCRFQLMTTHLGENRNPLGMVLAT